MISNVYFLNFKLLKFILDTDKISKIVNLMQLLDLNELEIEEKGFRLKLNRYTKNQNPAKIKSDIKTDNSYINNFKDQETKDIKSNYNYSLDNNQDITDTNISYIKSPMIGTCYLAPNPDSLPFVNVNSKIEENTVVCIIETMKVMNEITAKIKGIIIDILVNNNPNVA